jgi:diguanylate cyclase (GGDEF)-like protein
MTDAGDRHVIDDAFLARVVDAAFHPYVVIDRAGTILFCGSAVVDLLGAPPDQYVGCNIVEVLDPDTLDRTVDAFDQFVSPDRAATGWVGPPLTIALRHADGHLVSCRALAVPAGDPTFDGLILQIRATETTSKLDEAISSMVSGDDLDLTIARILEFATEQMPYSIGVVGRGFDGDRFESVVADPRAPSFDEVHLPLDVDPTPWREVLDGTDLAVTDVADIAPGVGRRADAAGFPACWARPIPRGGRTQDVLVFWRRAPGAPGPHLLEALERITRLIVLACEADRTRRLLEHQASTDDLTGLANRAALFERLADLESRPPGSPVGILYLDLDDFKVVNDQRGHSTGDRVLEIAARRIGSQVRAGDLVARIGGDEFAILCVGAGQDEIERLADRLVETFARAVTVDGREFDLGLSVGVALAQPAGAGFDPEQMLDRADRAMLRAKALGKHRWELAGDG